jgi:cyclohexanone monooxygenase
MGAGEETRMDGKTRFDAIVIGAGFAGLRTLYELRQIGLSTRVFEAASDVGGTWYWNRYPGARTDSESWVYAYSFSKELQDDWDWSERFPPQAEALAYLNHVADRFDMRKDIAFDTRIVSAAWDERAREWTVRDDKGGAYACTYLISAVGVLSTPYVPPFPGIEKFRGEWYVTGRWPKERVDFTDKRVLVIGSGATAIQAIPIIAQTARHLTVLQRTPNYVLPARNGPLTEEERQAIRRDYARIWAQAREHFFGFAMDPAGRTVRDVSPDEHQRILERGWETGGFRFIFETFDDIFIDERSNEIASEFIRNKIRTIVKDPATADLLCPKDYPLTAKRPPLGHFYYEAFNRPNVTLVDIKNDPIVAITEHGVRTETRAFDADMIVFATGFDAVTGTLMAMDVRGRGGVTVAEKWKDGPRTHLGIMIDGFPNLFMVLGPQSPFANIPVVIDGMVDWIGRALRHMRAHGLATMEAKPEAVEAWRKHVDQLVNATVLSKGRSWFLGDNIPGKPHVVLFHFGGAGVYRHECLAEAESGFEGFATTRA